MNKSLFLWHFGVNIQVSNECWHITSKSNVRHMDIIGIKLIKPPENDITLLAFLVGPIALSFGWL